MIMEYPVNKTVPVFASGQIKSLLNESYRMDFVKDQNNDTARLAKCKDDEIPESQYFRLTFYKNIIFGYTELCLDSYPSGTKS